MSQKKARRGQNVILTDRHIRQIQDVVKFHNNPTLRAFLRGCQTNDEIPLQSVKMVMETLNEVFWNDISLRQKQKDALRDLHDDLKKVYENSNAYSPQPKKPKMTLEEIKRRQQERKMRSSSFYPPHNSENNMSNLKNQLIRLGYEKPELRKDLRPILDSFTQKIGSDDEELMNWGRELLGDGLDRAISQRGQEDVLDELREIKEASEESLRMIKSSPLKIVKGPDWGDYYEAVTLSYKSLHFSLGKMDLSKTAQVKSLIRYLDPINEKVEYYIENISDPFHSNIFRTLQGISKYFKGRHLAYGAFVDSLKKAGLRIWS